MNRLHVKGNKNVGSFEFLKQSSEILSVSTSVSVDANTNTNTKTNDMKSSCILILSDILEHTLIQDLSLLDKEFKNTWMVRF